MSTSARLLLLGILSVLGMQCDVFADSILLESGFLSADVRFDFEPRFSLFGPDFHISGLAPTPTEFFRPSTTQPRLREPHTITATINVSSFPLVSPIFPFDPPIQLTYQGVTYQQPRIPGQPPPLPLYSGTFNFSALFPTIEAAGTGVVNFGEFTFSGNLLGPFGELTLEGGGFASAFALPLGGGFGAVRNVSLDFIPIAEPATMLLFGSGLLLYGLVSRCRRSFWQE